MQISPLSQQKFEGANFFKLPQELQKKMLNDTSFRKLSENYDIWVSATPKRTFKDPFCLRVPKVDEDSRLSCEVQTLEEYPEIFVFRAFTNNKFTAPLKDQVDTILKKLKEFDYLNRIE